jgi:hypothetical protein
MIFQKPKLSKIESFDDFLSSVTGFTDGQEKYYTDQLTKEIPVNPGINFGRVSNSIQNASTNNIPASKRFTESLSNRLFTDSTSKFTEADAKFCRSASHPSKLPARPPNATLACGWWYVDDLSVPSVGALGTRENPLFSTSLPVGGQYIWDIATASMKEDIKRCRQITNCTIVDIPDLEGKCGFCPDKGYAIPTNRNGGEKYPDIQSCNTDLILTSQYCPKQPATTGVAALENDYVGGFAVSAPDEERNSTPDDTVNGVAAISDSISRFNDVCDPDDNGILSRECLLSLSKGMGYTSGGAVVAMLTDPRRGLSDMDAIAIQILTNIGVSIPAALYGSGDIDFGSAKELYYKIMLVSSQGTKELYRQAANWLVYGTNEFNPCDLADDAQGPFFAQCIQQEFRKAGCQPAGAAYPKTMEQFGQFFYSKWANVKTQFADLYSSLSDDDGEVQDEAARNCLGIGVYREPVTECPELVGMWQRVSNDDAIRAMYNLRITQKDGGYYVEGWSGSGAGDVEYDSERRRGTFKLILYEDGETPWNVPFRYNPENKTLYWGGAEYDTPFRRIN